MTFDAALESLTAALGRRDRLDEAIAAMAADSRFTPVVNRLACLRGVATLTAFALAAEIDDWHRLSGATIGSYLGLVPGEHSTGGSRSQRGVTKTGNRYVRRLLVEAAWQHRTPTVPRRTCSDAGNAPRRGSPLMQRRAIGGCTRSGGPSMLGTSGPWWPTPPSPGSWPAGAGRWPSWTTAAARPADAACGPAVDSSGRLQRSTPRRAEGSPGARRGQRRSCSLRCACSTLTLPRSRSTPPLSEETSSHASDARHTSVR